MHTRGRRYTVWLLLVGTSVLLLAGCTALWTPQDALIGEMSPMKKVEYTTIQSGLLLYSAGHYLAGEPLQVGYDPYGYNYQSHMFRGSYANAYLGRDGYPAYDGDAATYLEDNPGVADHWTWPYRDVQLIMKWNDAWLSSRDYDGDGTLDRYYGYDSYIGSGAWLTNHQSGEYEVDGEICKWNYFVKIVAVPADAHKVAYPTPDPDVDLEIWYTADGTEIGPAIWGSFAIIQQVENDTCAGLHGVQYLSPTRPGLGNW